jgi:hypothetical protein
VDEPLGPEMDGYEILLRELKAHWECVTSGCVGRQSGIDSALLGYRLRDPETTSEGGLGIPRH